MIRLLLLWGYVAAVAGYAWKDWYKSLCGLVLLMGVIEHPDMPKSMFGVQGLNPWNILMLDIFLAWAFTRRREGLRWDMPVYVNVMLILYLGVILVGFARMMMGAFTFMLDVTTAGLVSEYLVNTLKWVIPGLLMYDGCRDKKRFLLGLSSLLGMYFILAIQVIKWMPASSVVSGEELAARSLKVLLNEIGFHRVNLSMMLAGASWAIFAALPLASTRRGKLLIWGASLLTLYGQALTAGRTGYATWALVGLLLCVLRWRKYLLLAPVVLLAIVTLVPGAVERMMQGFETENEVMGETKVDDYEVTAGRTLIWPYVIDKIGESPVFGYGRQAMRRTGLSTFLWIEFNEGFPHPHNAYLEMLLDNGWVGMVLVLPFYFVILFNAGRLFLDSRSPVFLAIGGATLALVTALLVASVGSQTFYPREGAVGLWCAIGLTFRVALERKRALQRGTLTAPGRLRGRVVPASTVVSVSAPAPAWRGALSVGPSSILPSEGAADDGLWSRAS